MIILISVVSGWILRKFAGNLEQRQKGNPYRDRYDYSERVKVYRELVDHSNSIMPGVKVRLSTEAISVWKDVGLTWE